ncbi:MAG: D-amino acid dehydrogenase [Alphaproteobacteria bacterium]|nr:D-amino acid dehydrogenase [Alphaproteobacteria bacterium]
MKILVLGSGLLGVTSAYALAKRGFDVTVIDRKATSGAETSFANGGQLSYSHAEPWANPTVTRHLLKFILDPNSPLVLRPRADRAMIKWGLQFLQNCSEKRARVNCVNILRLGLYSREEMATLRADTGIAFDFSARGILHVFGDDQSFDHAKHHNEFQARFGGDERVLTTEEVFALEPALAHTERTIIGGIHAHMDESGDAYMFCNALEAHIREKFGVKFLHGVTIQSMKTEGNRIAAVSTDQGDMTADGFVMAMGSYSPLLLKPIGIDLPIYPMKGYSITLPANEYCPNMSLTDGTFKIVYSRLGDRLRIAGTAEFAGHNDKVRERRITPIIKAARGLLPKADWNADISRWACLRPSTPDGPPIIGKTPYFNLFLNTGHGTLGWTQAAGSATLLADIMENKPPAIITAGLTLERYLS